MNDVAALVMFVNYMGTLVALLALVAAAWALWGPAEPLDAVALARPALRRLLRRQMAMAFVGGTMNWGFAEWAFHGLTHLVERGTPQFGGPLPLGAVVCLASACFLSTGGYVLLQNDAILKEWQTSHQ